LENLSGFLNIRPLAKVNFCPPNLQEKKLRPLSSPLLGENERGWRNLNSKSLKIGGCEGAFQDLCKRSIVFDNLSEHAPIEFK
jgi:hypothetical protein